MQGFKPNHADPDDGMFSIKLGCELRRQNLANDIGINSVIEENPTRDHAFDAVEKCHLMVDTDDLGSGIRLFLRSGVCAERHANQHCRYRKQGHRHANRFSKKTYAGGPNQNSRIAKGGDGGEG